MVQRSVPTSIKCAKPKMNQPGSKRLAQAVTLLSYEARRGSEETNKLFSSAFKLVSYYVAKVFAKPLSHLPLKLLLGC